VWGYANLAGEDYVEHQTICDTEDWTKWGRFRKMRPTGKPSREMNIGRNEYATKEYGRTR
jgi:hypothetical protein